MYYDYGNVKVSERICQRADHRPEIVNPSCSRICAVT